MTRLKLFISIVFRNDPQYGYIGLRLSWKLSGILAEHADDWQLIK